MFHCLKTNENMSIFLHSILLLSLILTNKNSNCFETVIKFNPNSSLTSQNLIDLSNQYNLKLKKKLFNEYYIFESEIKNNSKHKRSIQNDIQLKLDQDPRIQWFEIQKHLQRIKRDYFDFHTDNEDHHHTYKSKFTCDQGTYSFNDPEWANQWYMNDGCDQGYNLNITKAWSMGFTGKGVKISIIDDGIEKDNSELADNYDQFASYDLNDDDNDPQPRYEETNENKHGTRCAGEIAAKPNNSFCGVGVAYNSKIGGIRLLDGKITDRLEAEALSFNSNYIDIFSASWGPLDDGKTVDGPGLLSTKAFFNGAKHGRNGKGTIYVWAAGNGGRLNDNCNCDGYTSSIYTITIGGVTQEGEMPVYSEKCSVILASTFSSGNVFQAGIITSDLHNGCTKRHSGTSASAPIGAGIIGLVLEARPELTWRDVQYLVILSSSPVKLRAEDWRKNGIGKYFSHNYGYGLMNAGNMVEQALGWSLIGDQVKCTVKYLELIKNGVVLVEKKVIGYFH